MQRINILYGGGENSEYFDLTTEQSPLGKMINYLFTLKKMSQLIQKAILLIDIDNSTFKEKETQRSSSSFGKKEYNDGLENFSDCQEIKPIKITQMIRPKKVNPKLRSPISKLRINMRVWGNKGN